jgi:hypothetical protein
MSINRLVCNNGKIQLKELHESDLNQEEASRETYRKQRKTDHQGNCGL